MTLKVEGKEKRPHAVSLRFTDRQLDWLERTATENGVRIQDVVRSLIDQHLNS